MSHNMLLYLETNISCYLELDEAAKGCLWGALLSEALV